MSKLESLYAKKFRMEAMVEAAMRNGESRKRIERLEEQISKVNAQIDSENIRLYSK